MRKLLIKFLVLFVAFLASVLIFSSVFNRRETVNTSDLEPASLPVLYMATGGMTINPMQGYTVKMQEKTMRDNVTPISTSRDLTLVVEPKESTVESVSFTVTTPDGAAVVEERKLSLNEGEDGMIAMDFQLENPILMNQEYLLHFTVTLAGGQKVYYYTRVLQRAGLNTGQYLEFVTNFYEKCMNKEAAIELSTYLESTEGVGDGDLAKVDIHSSFDRVTWGDLNPQIARKAYPNIKEINETTCSVTQDYVISSLDDEGQTEYYRVHEFYRMRYYSSRVRLLNFERETEMIYDSSLASLSSSGVSLGITPVGETIVTDENVDVAAFQQSGELFTFNRSSSKISRIFSFRTDGELDMRELGNRHKIKVIRVTEGGDVDFLVYGYMSNDRYEGQNGALVLHYDAQQNISREQLFIPCNTSFSCMERDLGEFSYITTGGIFYILIDSTLYKVDLNDGSSEILLDQINGSCFVASSSQKTVAWMDQMQPERSTTITMMDLETGATHLITAPSGSYLRALGFLNEDLVYGLAAEEDILEDTFAMATVRIESFSGTVVKEYTQNDTWVTEASVTEESVELVRVKKNKKGKYKSAEADRIVNNVQSGSESITVSRSAEERRGMVAWLNFSQPLREEVPVVMETKYSSYMGDQRLEAAFRGFSDAAFQVYAMGEFQGEYANVAEAINAADELTGVVLNADQQYVWERGNIKEKMNIPLESLPENVLSVPETPAAFSEVLGDGYQVMDLKGCLLSQALYHVSQGRPVAAETPDGFVLIVGFDQYNVILYNTEKKETYYGGMNDSTAMFEETGNNFITYMEKVSQK